MNEIVNKLMESIILRVTPMDIGGIEKFSIRHFIPRSNNNFFLNYLLLTLHSTLFPYSPFRHYQLT